jgi:hypothetical protein
MHNNRSAVWKTVAGAAESAALGCAAHAAA